MSGGASAGGMKGGISQVMTTEEEGGGGGMKTPDWADVTGDVITDPDQDQKKNKGMNKDI